MAVIVNGDGILTGISSLATSLTDITSGRGTITGVTTVGTLQLGAGVSISSPRSQNAAIFTNNTEFLTVDDAGRVGIAITNPTTKFDVNGTSKFQDDVTFTGATYNASWDKSVNSLIFTDNAKAVFGTGSDLEIKHTGSNSQIIHSGTGNVFLDSIGGSVNLRAGDNAGGVHNSVVCNLDAGVDLYHNNTLILNTTSSGVTIQNGHLALNRQDTGNEGGEIVFNRASDNANQWFNDVYGNDSSARIRWHHGGAEKVSFITDGGITFNGDTATANALDDYEEGTWVPNVYNAGSSSNWTAKDGDYQKVGNKVTVWMRVDGGTSPRSGASGGHLTITGLPFALSGMDSNTILGIAGANFITTGSRDVNVSTSGSGNPFVRKGGNNEAEQCNYFSACFTYKTTE